ncbi:MAG TPA: CIA30 family protein [Polyangia bacterium]|nr:CIA30 family protein [Polyangia bacterium]
MKFGPNQTAVALLATLGLGAFVAACGAEPTGAAEDTAAARAGSSIDSFNETDTSAWVPFADASSSVTTSRAADHADSSGASLQVAYRVGSGGYAGLERNFSTPRDWAAASAINLWVNGQATGHTFLVQVYDAGHERWESRFTVGFTGWQQITLPFAGMKPAGWQPPEATADGVQNFSGVTGMAIVPSEGTGAGTVTIDALAVGAGSTAAVTSATTPAAAPTTPTPTTPTAVPTTPTAAPATPAVTTPAATPAAATTPVPSGLVGTTGVNGTIIPLYTDPGDSSWAAVVAAKQAHPTVPVIAIVNPSDGPGAAKSAAYVTGITKLVSAGVKVIGYVHTLYGDRPTAQLQAEMDQWHSWYPNVTGIFFDEMANSPGHESYYSALGAYAKSHGGDFTVGNPGTDTSQSYVGTLDVLLIYESDGLPSMSAITGWHSAYARTNFGVIPYKVPALDAAFVAAARPYVGYIYLQSDDLSNPWDSVPTYLTNLVGALQ